MTLIAQSITPAWQRDAAEGRQRVERLLGLSQDALAEMRALLFELRSPDLPADPTADTGKIPGIVRLKRDGLVQALERHIEGVARDGLTITLSAPSYHSLSLDCEIALYRVTQEALNNVVKHAQAEHVDIELLESNGTVSLSVLDDGVGFSLESGPVKLPGGRFPRAGLGLRTMRERVEALGGSFRIQSHPGEGTRVQAVVPGQVVSG
jgi:signal transduction histidine kinase